MFDSIPAPLILNPVTPDYPGFYNAMLNDLAQSPTGSWNDLAVSGTGTTIVRWIASWAAFGQGSIGRALQEAFPDTARSPSAVFRACRLQGIHIIRSRPGSIGVTLTRTDNLATPLIIPALSQFTVGGQAFYNTTSITLSGTGASIAATLNRGQLATLTFTGSGLPLQFYVLGSPGTWSISDVDVWMTDSTGAVWTSIRTGLWRETSGNNTFFESTLPDGTVHCQFGDGTYGNIPPAGQVVFTYVNLASAVVSATTPVVGTIGNAVGFAVTAVSTTNASPNQDPPTPDFYKAMGPGGPANNLRGVTRDDIRAITLQYDGVVDALFRGQAELNPSDIRFMNSLSATLLTTSLWTQQQWLTFKQYMESGIIPATCVLRRDDPKPVTVNVSLEVAATTSASLDSLTTLVTQVVDTFFTPSDESLGKSLEPSDLIIAIMESATYLQAPGESGSLIDYVRVNAPANPVVIPNTSYLVLGTLTLNVHYTQRGLSAAVTGSITGL